MTKKVICMTLIGILIFSITSGCRKQIAEETTQDVIESMPDHVVSEILNSGEAIELPGISAEDWDEDDSVETFESIADTQKPATQSDTMEEQQSETSSATEETASTDTKPTEMDTPSKLEIGENLLEGVEIDSWD